MKVYVVYEADWDYQNNRCVLTDEAKAKGHNKKQDERRKAERHALKEVAPCLS